MCSLIIAGWWFCSAEPLAQGVWSLMMDVGDGRPTTTEAYPTKELCKVDEDISGRMLGEYGVVFRCEQMFGFKVQK